MIFSCDCKVALTRSVDSGSDFRDSCFVGNRDQVIWSNSRPSNFTPQRPSTMFCGLGVKLSQSFSRGSRRRHERKELKQQKKRRSRSLDSIDFEISAEFSTVTMYEEKIEVGGFDNCNYKNRKVAYLREN